MLADTNAPHPPQRTLVELKEGGYVRPGDLVIVVSDIKPPPPPGAPPAPAKAPGGSEPVHIRSVQVRHVQ